MRHLVPRKLSHVQIMPRPPKMKHKKLILDKLEVAEIVMKKISGLLDEISGSGQDTGDDDDILVLQLIRETRDLILDED